MLTVVALSILAGTLVSCLLTVPLTCHERDGSGARLEYGSWFVLTWNAQHFNSGLWLGEVPVLSGALSVATSIEPQRQIGF